MGNSAKEFVISGIELYRDPEIEEIKQTLFDELDLSLTKEGRRFVLSSAKLESLFLKYKHDSVSFREYRAIIGSSKWQLQLLLYMYYVEKLSLRGENKEAQIENIQSKIRDKFDRCILGILEFISTYTVSSQERSEQVKFQINNLKEGVLLDDLICVSNELPISIEEKEKVRENIGNFLNIGERKEGSNVISMGIFDFSILKEYLIKPSNRSIEALSIGNVEERFREIENQDQLGLFLIELCKNPNLKTYLFENPKIKNRFLTNLKQKLKFCSVDQIEKIINMLIDIEEEQDQSHYSWYRNLGFLISEVRNLENSYNELKPNLGKEIAIQINNAESVKPVSILKKLILSYKELYRLNSRFAEDLISLEKMKGLVEEANLIMRGKESLREEKFVDKEKQKKYINRFVEIYAKKETREQVSRIDECKSQGGFFGVLKAFGSKINYSFRSESVKEKIYNDSKSILYKNIKLISILKDSFVTGNALDVNEIWGSVGDEEISFDSIKHAINTVNRINNHNCADTYPQEVERKSITPRLVRAVDDSYEIMSRTTKDYIELRRDPFAIDLVARFLLEKKYERNDLLKNGGEITKANLKKLLFKKLGIDFDGYRSLYKNFNNTIQNSVSERSGFMSLIIAKARNLEQQFDLVSQEHDLAS